MAWMPGALGFSRDDVIVAVGMQCRKKHFPVKDVLQWLGPPAKSVGDASAGNLVYFYSYNFWGAPMFGVLAGQVVEFVVIAISGNNSKRVDPRTGNEVFFNFLDEMQPFNEQAFTITASNKEPEATR